MSFNTKLIDLLKTNQSLVDDEGELLTAAIQDKAWKIDHDLIKLLLSDPDVKKAFFEEIEGHWIFNINKFIEYITQKNFLDNSYTRFRNKIGLTIDGKYLNERGEIELAWPYKDCVLEGGQTKEEEKRKEIFFNEVLAQDEINRLLDPKVLTNFVRYTPSGQEDVTEIKRNENGVISENLIIKGNNLLALHTLKEQFKGQIKLIYIDPPFNTGNDTFGYNDSFNHSTWLTFIKNRLDVAKNLLADGGAIVVHCDYVEESYLKVIMDEVFGKENFLNSISLRDSHPSGLKLSARDKTIVKTKSTMLVYKNIGEITIKPIYQKRNDWDTHFNIYLDTDSNIKKKENLREYLERSGVIAKPDFKLDETALSSIEFKEFVFENRERIFQSTKELPEYAKTESLAKPNEVIEYSEGEYAFNGRRLSPLKNSIYDVGFDGYKVEDFAKLICDFWDDIDFNNLQSEGGISFPSGKKPELLLARLITMFTNKSDIVLDFFSGSGTTVSVSHKMERQYIGIEQLDYGDNGFITRLLNVIGGESSGISRQLCWKGGGNFVYCELLRFNEKFIERILGTNKSEDLIGIWKDVAAKSFLNWYINPLVPEDAINDFKEIGRQENGLEKQKKLLLELLDKNQLYVNLSEIDDEQFNISEEDKALNRAFYGEI